MDLSTADPMLGRLLDGRYRVDARVARGGMATVYTGFDTRLDRSVAIKVMHDTLAEDEAFVDRFRREAKSAARLSHPNVVAIYDQGESDGSVYLVMEHVAGTTLRDLVRAEGALEPDRALAVLDGLLGALAAAHAAGIVHRDVKPENVLIAAGGVVKVADFGLARAIDATHHTLADGSLIGTVAYLAPEQVVTGAADARTDLYAAGVVLFELLTGAPPFHGDAPLAVAYRHVNEDVPAPSTLRPGLPRALDVLVTTATRRDPADRYADAPAMLAAVRRARAALGGTDTSVIPLDDAPTLVTPLPVTPPGAPPAPAAPVAAKPPKEPKQPKQKRPRRRRRALVIGLVVAALLGGIAAAGWYAGSARDVSAPRLLGLSLAAARQAAADGHVELVVGTQVFSDDVPAGQVADQDPDPGSGMDRGGTVTVHLSKGVDLVSVPDVRGKTLEAATAALKTARLSVGETTREFSDTVAEGLVISTDPATGRVRAGSKVALLVSRGPVPVEVPRVVGDKRDDAIAKLRAVGLRTDVAEAYDEKVEAGRVISQTPVGGTTVGRGSTVHLVVSKGPPLVAVPDVVDELRDDARRMLERVGLKVQFVDFPGRRGRHVYDQDPNGGAQVPKGTTVTLYMV